MLAVLAHVQKLCLPEKLMLQQRWKKKLHRAKSKASAGFIFFLFHFNKCHRSETTVQTQMNRMDTAWVNSLCSCSTAESRHEDPCRPKLKDWNSWSTRTRQDGGFCTQWQICKLFKFLLAAPQVSGFSFRFWGSVTCTVKVIVKEKQYKVGRAWCLLRLWLGCYFLWVLMRNTDSRSWRRRGASEDEEL